MHTKSAITFLTRYNRLGLIHYVYVLNIYKFVTINTFNCNGTIAFITFSFIKVIYLREPTITYLLLLLPEVIKKVLLLIEIF